MSHPFPGAASRPPASASPSPDSPAPGQSELTDRIRHFQEAARNVLALDAADGDQEQRAASRPLSAPDGEIRCYHLSAATLRANRSFWTGTGPRIFAIC